MTSHHDVCNRASSSAAAWPSAAGPVASVRAPGIGSSRREKHRTSARWSGIEIKSDHVPELRLEMGIVRKLERLDDVRLSSFFDQIRCTVECETPTCRPIRCARSAFARLGGRVTSLTMRSILCTEIEGLRARQPLRGPPGLAFRAPCPGRNALGRRLQLLGNLVHAEPVQPQ